MKLNNKGFLLAETIVTVCIIATLATSMYLYVSKTASRFEERDSYENVVDVYKVNTLKQYLSNNNLLTSTRKISDENLGVLKEELNIESVYLIPNKTDGKNLITTDNQALRDYINWITVDNDDNRRLIVWFKGDGNEDGTFANLVIKK